MPTDTDVTVQANPDDIESNCSANPIDADGPTDAPCGNDAVTMCFRPDGRRSYLCEDHAEQALRFGDDDVFDGDAPTLVTCKRCVKPTPRNRIGVDVICEECQV